MQKISKKEKFLYGLGDLSGNIMLAAFSFYLLFFMVSVGGLKPALASLVFLVAKGWDAVTDIWMGRISDNTKSKWGKRKIYMIFGAIPFGLMFILLWLCPFKDTSGQAIRFIYYLLAYCLFNTTWTIVYVPYNALTANMTQNYDERSSLTTVRIVMANVGLLLGAAIFGLLAGNGSIFQELFISKGFEAYKATQYSYMASSIVFGIISAITMLISGLGVHERYDAQAEKNKYSLLKTIGQFFKMKEFRYMTAYYLTSLLTFDIIMALFMFYISDTLGFNSDGTLTMIFIALPLLVAMLTSVMWDKLSAKYEKHKMFALSASICSLGLLILLFIPQLPDALYQATEETVSMGQLLSTPSAIMLIITVIIVGIGMSGIQIMPYASIPDIVELDEYTYGVRREGAYYGVQSFMYKLANGLSLAVVSLLLGLFHYKETPFTDEAGTVVYSYIQPMEARQAVRYMFALLPIAIFIISIICAFKANMGRKRYEEITKALAERHAQEQPQEQPQEQTQE